MKIMVSPAQPFDLRLPVVDHILAFAIIEPGTVDATKAFEFTLSFRCTLDNFITKGYPTLACLASINVRNASGDDRQPSLPNKTIDLVYFPLLQTVLPHPATNFNAYSSAAS
jgi:hypothetical protein